MSLTIKMRNSGPHVHLSLEGFLDENADLPLFPQALAGHLEIDLEKLTMINSMGCRKWAQWIRAETFVNSQVYLLRCSPAVMNQVNTLSGFLPAHVRVQSFFVPYYCEGCGFEDRVLLTHGHEFNDSGHLSLAEDMPCPSCKAIMSLDVLRERYFRFLVTGKIA